MKRYLIIIWEDVSPETHGPFTSESHREEVARMIRKADPILKNGIFWADVNYEGFLEVGEYSQDWTDEVLSDDN